MIFSTKQDHYRMLGTRSDGGSGGKRMKSGVLVDTRHPGIHYIEAW